MSDYPRWDDDFEDWPVIELPVDLDLPINAEDLAHGFHIETVYTDPEETE